MLKVNSTCSNGGFTQKSVLQLLGISAIMTIPNACFTGAISVSPIAKIYSLLLSSAICILFLFTMRYFSGADKDIDENKRFFLLTNMSAFIFLNSVFSFSLFNHRTGSFLLVLLVGRIVGGLSEFKGIEVTLKTLCLLTVSFIAFTTFLQLYMLRPDVTIVAGINIFYAFLLFLLINICLSKKKNRTVAFKIICCAMICCEKIIAWIWKKAWETITKFLMTFASLASSYFIFRILNNFEQGKWICRQSMILFSKIVGAEFAFNHEANCLVFVFWLFSYIPISYISVRVLKPNKKFVRLFRMESVTQKQNIFACSLAAFTSFASVLPEIKVSLISFLIPFIKLHFVSLFTLVSVAVLIFGFLFYEKIVKFISKKYDSLKKEAKSTWNSAGKINFDNPKTFKKKFLNHLK